MTDDARALLAAIVADPADDTARLAYADCIEENGNSARAEFIRLQIEAERIFAPRLLEVPITLGIRNERHTDDVLRWNKRPARSKQPVATTPTVASTSTRSARSSTRCSSRKSRTRAIR